MREAIASEFDRVYDLVRGVVERHGGYNKEDIRACLAAGEMQAHVHGDDEIKFAVITEIVRYPRRWVYLLLFAGGNGIGEWKDTAKEYFETNARYFGCAEMQVIGRLGWGRVYPKAKTAWAIYRETL